MGVLGADEVVCTIRAHTGNEWRLTSRAAPHNADFGQQERPTVAGHQAIDIAPGGGAVGGVAVWLPGAVQAQAPPPAKCPRRGATTGMGSGHPCASTRHGELAAGGRVGQLAGVAEGARQRRPLGAAIRVVAGAGGDVAGVVEQLAGAALAVVAVPGPCAGGRVQRGQAVQAPQLVDRAGVRAAAGGDRQLTTRARVPAARRRGPGRSRW